MAFAQDFRCMVKEHVLAIQRYYPRIYMACHVAHTRATSNRWRLSAHDAVILAHLHREHAISPGELCRHLRVAASSLSATLARLRRLEYVEITASLADKRIREIRLSASGVEAMSAASVLDAGRLERALERLSLHERVAAVRSLEVLAVAAEEELEGFE